MENLLFFFSSLFFADLDFSQVVTADDNKTFDYWGQFINMLISLGVLLGLILISVWFLKKFMASRNRLINKNTSIQVLERRALSQKSCLYLVQVEGTKILISDSPAGPAMLCRVDPETTVVESYEEEPLPPFTASLSAKLKKFFIKHG